MEFKSLKIDDLHQYSDRHGFIFQGHESQDNNFPHRAAKMLVECEYADCLPEFFVRINAIVFVAVYPEGVSFRMPALLGHCREIMNRKFNIDSLGAWLKTQQKPLQSPKPAA